MVQLALANYLGTQLYPQAKWTTPGSCAIRNLVYANTVEAMGLEDRAAALQLLKSIKVLDPAVGQGAFLLGMCDQLLRLRCLLGESRNREQITQDILTTNLYGVDRDAQAVDFCHQHSLVQVICGDSLVEIPVQWGKFNLVLANPPYVRQEFLTKSYKQYLIQRFQEQGIYLKERSDLYVYFFARLKELLTDGGTAVVISASSWLDVDYGVPLQRHILESYRLHLVMESCCERWFREAGINTNIVLLEKTDAASLPSGEKGLIRFVQLKRKLAHYQSVGRAALGELMEKVLAPDLYQDNDELRIYPRSQQQLLSLTRVEKPQVEQPKRKQPQGEQPPEDQFPGEQWGQFLRAPQVFRQILARGRDMLTTLGELADVRFGIKTGCNQFFYLRGAQLTTIEQQYQVAVVKSPREVPGMQVDLAKLKYRLLAVNQELRALQGTQAQEYIAQGEEAGYHLRPSVKNRDLWYRVEIKKEPGLLFRRFFHDKFNIPLVAANIAEDQTFYRVVYAGEVELLGAVINSTITALFLELSGRQALGDGVLQFAVYQAAQLLVVNPESISAASREKLRAAFAQLSNRDAQTIYLEVQQPDRQQLDLAVLEILGFQDEESSIVLEQVYRAVTGLVQQRLTRAQSYLTEV
ncbi:MAG: Eco57I restriction-modification methylase domain-containing protein [Carboxydocellales bacterium]